jgi:branched-chain amino acid transport system ATP-binding protein
LRVRTLLELDDVTASYGPVQALHGVSLTVGEGEVVAVLGANGAGKTTTLRAISGTVARGGAIDFDGKMLRGGPETAARMGIAHVPEGRGTFVELTVEENLRLGAYTRRDRRLVNEDLRRVAQHFPWMTERASQRAGTLSGGEQQMLALGRALMSRPRLLLLDEPSLGLAPLVVRELFRTVRELNAQEGLTVLVVEQDARIALSVSSRAYVLEVGRVALAGTSDGLRDAESVRRSYLGY